MEANITPERGRQGPVRLALPAEVTAVLQHSAIVVRAAGPAPRNGCPTPRAGHKEAERLWLLYRCVCVDRRAPCGAQVTGDSVTGSSLLPGGRRGQQVPGCPPQTAALMWIFVPAALPRPGCSHRLTKLFRNLLLVLIGRENVTEQDQQLLNNQKPP